MGILNLNFNDLPINTLVGADRRTFEVVTRGAEIDETYRRKYRLTKLK